MVEGKTATGTAVAQTTQPATGITATGAEERAAVIVSSSRVLPLLTHSPLSSYLAEYYQRRGQVKRGKEGGRREERSTGEGR